MTFILVTGPSRSGKSLFAEQLALRSGQPILYIATSPPPDPSDLEWQARIRLHQQRRPTNWQTLEIPLRLNETLATPIPGSCYLVDSLGSWTANHLDTADSDWETQTSLLCQTLTTTQNLIILVAEEVGWGVVPAFASGRLFRDRLGQLVQQVGQIADPVYLVVAGHAIDLRKWGDPVGD